MNLKNSFWSRLSPRGFAWAWALVSLAAFAGAAQANQINKTVLNDGSVIGLSNPRHAVDSNGNLHIVAQGWSAANPGENVELYYMLVQPNGTVLIDATKINTPNGNKDGRPEIAVLPNNKAVITWFRGGNGGPAQALRYVLVDPSGDDQNGDAANPADILETTETPIGSNTGRGHHSVAVDSGGIAHVAMCKSDQLRYISFNPTTNAVVSAEVQRGTCEQRVRPALGIDSNGDVHIAFDGTSDRAAAYTMLDGASGAVLIAPTQLFNAALISPKAAHFSLMMDDDKVHIVYGDKRNTVDADDWCNECFQGGTAIYTGLDPSQDDQDGSAANINTIRMLNDEVELGGLWYGQAFLDGALIHFIAPNGKGGNLTHLAVNKNTGNVLLDPRTYTAQLGGAGWSRHYVSGVGDRVLWSESVFSAPLANGTLKLVMATASAFSARPVEEVDQNIIPFFPASGGGGGGAPSLALLMLFGLVGLLRLRAKQPR